MTWFARAGSGLGALALGSLLAQDGVQAAVKGIRSRRRSPIIRRRRSPSSGCSWKAGRATSTCSTRSRNSRSWPASRCREASVGRSRRWARRATRIMPSQAQMEAARPERHLGFRLVPAHRRARGRSRRHPFLLGGRNQPRRLGLPDEHRLDPRRPAVAGRVGQLTAWAARTRTCRRSSC